MKVNIGIFGFGAIGQYLYRYIQQNTKLLKATNTKKGIKRIALCL